jgi:hypothetical protein
MHATVELQMLLLVARQQPVNNVMTSHATGVGGISIVCCSATVGATVTGFLGIGEKAI